MKNQRRLLMKLFLSLLVCGHLVDQLVVDKMMKKIKKNSILFGDQLQRLNSLNKVMLSIITVILVKPHGKLGIIVSNHINTKKILVSLKSMLLLSILLDLDISCRNMLIDSNQLCLLVMLELVRQLS